MEHQSDIKENWSIGYKLHQNIFHHHHEQLVNKIRPNMNDVSLDDSMLKQMNTFKALTAKL